jgi:2-methylcitrate dehydratase PrpD
MVVTETIAKFVASARYEEFPTEALRTAKTAVLDCLGVAVAGSSEASARICADLVGSERAHEESTVFGRGFRTSALHAAFANGTAAHALDFDHSFTLMGQPTAPIIPALFALGESLGVSGKQILEAYICGFETTAKLVLSLRDRTEDGWHPPSSLGSFGAAAACAKLLALDVSHMEMALGIAASMASGLICNFGTMSKPLHVGLGARNGIMAAKLAQSGFTANNQAIETGVGFYEVAYPGAKPDLNSIEELGKRYELLANGIRVKPYPCGGLTHPAIDAALAFRSALNVTAEMVESIDVHVPRHTFERIVFQVPQTGLQGKFSMPYLIARAVIDGNVTLACFTDSAVREPGVLAFAKRVKMHPDADLKATDDGSRPCRLEARLRDGRSYARRVDFAKGTSRAPLTADELRNKFLDCARQRLDDDAAQQAWNLIEALENIDDIRPLCRLLQG